MERPVNRKPPLPRLPRLPRDVVPTAVKPRTLKPMGPRTVGAFVPGLTRKAFEKHGFSTVALLTDWAVIAGANLAAYAVPERLKWQKNVDAYGAVEDGAQGRPGATLVLRVEGSRAIDVQMQARQIIDRINAYFGYRAVAELRLVQGPVASEQRGDRRRPAPAPHPASPEVAGVADPGLREALARLEASIAGERTR